VDDHGCGEPDEHRGDGEPVPPQQSPRSTPHPRRDQRPGTGHERRAGPSAFGASSAGTRAVGAVGAVGQWARARGGTVGQVRCRPAPRTDPVGCAGLCAHACTLGIARPCRCRIRATCGHDDGRRPWGRRPCAETALTQEPDEPDDVEAFDELDDPEALDEPDELDEPEVLEPEVLEDEPDVLELSLDELVLLEAEAGFDEPEDDPDDFFELLSVR